MPANKPAARTAIRRAPKQARSSRTVATLLEAAAQVITAARDEQLNTNRIAEVAGYSIGTLYQYFPNKESIVLALVGRERIKVMAELQRLLDSTQAGSVTQRLNLLISFTLLHFYRRRRIRRFVILVLAQAGTFLDCYRTLAELDQAAEQLLVRFIEDASRVPRPVTGFVMARVMLGSLRAAVLENSRWQGTPELADEMRHLLHALLESLPATAAQGTPATVDLQVPLEMSIYAVDPLVQRFSSDPLGADVEAAASLAMAAQAERLNGTRRAPKQERSRQTFEAIVLAAARVISGTRKGRLNIQRIAALARCSVPTLYQYFPNHGAILLALVELERERIASALIAVMDTCRGRPLEDRVEAVVRYAVHHFNRYRRVRLHIFRNCLQAGGFFQFHHAVTQIDRLAEGLVLQLIADSGRLARPATSFLLTRAVLSTMRAALLENASWQGSPELAQELQHLVCAAIRTLPMDDQHPVQVPRVSG